MAPKSTGTDQAGTLAKPQVDLSASMLPDGRVLVVGMFSAEVWDATTGTFVSGDGLATWPYLHDGTVLAAGWPMRLGLLVSIIVGVAVAVGGETIRTRREATA